MADFYKALKNTLENEGGYVFDIDDPGGETYKGVSRRYHQHWDGWTIIDQAKKDPDFPLILDDSKELRDEIEELYLTEYWHKIKGNDMKSQLVGNAVFDSCVLNGVFVASKLAQEASGAIADGIVGKNTINHINSIVGIDFLVLFMLLSIKRYHGIGTDREKSRKYFFGWTGRVLTYSEV